MSYITNINNNFFSPLKIIQNKNSTRSQNNIFTSTERKKKSLEKSQDFLSSTIKKTDEEEYEEIIQKRKNINRRIDEVISLLSKKKFNNSNDLNIDNYINNDNDINKKNDISKVTKNYQKYLFANNKNSKYLEK